MIIYNANKESFFDHVRKNEIVRIIKQNFIDKGLSGGTESEMKSWTNSLNFMKNVLDTPNIPNDVHIAIEYKIPFSAKRIDFLIAGLDTNFKKTIIVIELKQWQKAVVTEKEDIVQTFVGNKNREVLHPSYQALQYKYLLNSFNKELNEGRIECFSCAYMHNMDKDKNFNLVNIQLFKYVDESPIYFADDYQKLQDKIITLTKNGKGKEILYEIENGEVVPSKKLIEVVGSTIEGNDEFMLIDSQKEVFSNIISKAKEKDNVFIINGNPGTGKSVVAINLLSKLLSLKQNIAFSAPNAAFRNTLIETIKSYSKEKKQKIMFDILFKSSSTFYDIKTNTYDWVIVDEAHRLKGKGTYMYKGENQIEDIIKASKNSVFFIDEEQKIVPKDIGTNNNIIAAAKKFNKNVYYGDDYILETQFRCSGADGYINAIKNILQISETGNHYLNVDGAYDVKICDSIHELDHLIRKKIDDGYKTSRLVAGYAWKWETKNKTLNELVYEHDIKIDDWSAPWNYNDSKMTWAIRDDGVMQVGCVHTCQGLEFEYCGVIIGNDIRIDENNILHADYDNYYDVSGKKGLKNNNDELTKLVKNIYKVLLTRGQKGTYIYICDERLREYFKKHIKTKNNY